MFALRGRALLSHYCTHADAAAPAAPPTFQPFSPRCTMESEANDYFSLTLNHSFPILENRPFPFLNARLNQIHPGNTPPPLQTLSLPFAELVCAHGRWSRVRGGRKWRKLSLNSDFYQQDENGPFNERGVQIILGFKWELRCIT